MNISAPDLVAASPPADAERLAGTILVVDDESTIRESLARFLERQGHTVRTAANVTDAVRIVAAERFDLVITDLKLPDRTGIDLLVEIRARAPETRLILMSAYADVPAAASAIEQGIDFLFAKPFPLAEIGQQAAQSIARHRAADRAERTRKRLEARLELSELEGRSWVRRAAHALAMAVEAKDRYTAGHARRVTEYAITIAEVVGGIDLLSFHLAGELHDVGKIGVPDQVLNKPDRLTADEFAMVREHPVTGARILQPLVDDLLVIGVVLWHHERWDGQGYPDGLSGEKIPLPARILAVADTLDAMTSRRAYRDGLPWAVAVEEIRRCSGSQFDPAVVAAFEQALPKLADQYRHFCAGEDADSRARRLGAEAGAD